MSSIFRPLDELEDYVAAYERLMNYFRHSFGMLVIERLQQDWNLVAELGASPREIDLFMALLHGV